MKVHKSGSSMAEAVYNAFLSHCIDIEARVFTIAGQVLAEPPAVYEFWELGTTGIFVPDLSTETVKVNCMGMQCDLEMDRATLGAALTLMAVNHTIWSVHERGEDTAYLIKLQGDLQELVYEEGNQFDNSAIFTFLD